MEAGTIITLGVTFVLLWFKQQRDTVRKCMGRLFSLFILYIYFSFFLKKIYIGTAFKETTDKSIRFIRYLVGVKNKLYTYILYHTQNSLTLIKPIDLSFHIGRYHGFNGSHV
jgi:hypothetical protein